MQLGGLRELSNLVMVSMISFRNFTPAVGLIPEAIGISRATSEFHLSPSAKQLFTANKDVDPAAHLRASQSRYDELQTKIHRSVSEGKIIHVEDGEADDLWHDLHGLQQGVTPQLVLLSGGYYKLRAKCANIMWDYFAEKTGTKKPQIMTVYANIGSDLQNFDYAEGSGLLQQGEIGILKTASLDLNNPEYLQEVDQALGSLRSTLVSNDFTTIALKTSPAELVEIIEEFKHKVAIIWTGPVDKVPGSMKWAAKFNYAKAPKAGDRLLDIGVPIVVISPRVGNGRMHSIVDEQFWSKNLDLLRESNFILPTELSFPGFERLANIARQPNAKFSYYIFSLADSLRDITIETAQKARALLNQEEKELERNPGHDFEIKMRQIQLLKQIKLPLGERWAKHREQNTKDSTFREFCPVDQTLQLVTDPEMKQSVKEVVEVEMKRLGTSRSQLEIDVKPQLGSNVFLITQMDTAPLEGKIQSIINWMAEGEKKYL